jgi:hypothetical protein
MKNVSIIILLFSCALLSFDWVADGAKWHYYENGFARFRVIIIEKGNDTIIESKNVTILNETIYEWNFTHMEIPYIYPSAPAYYTYASGDTVFFYMGGEYKWFYHFNLQVGDSIDYDYLGGCGCDIGICVVDSTGTIVINSDTLRWIFLRPLATSGFGFNGKIIERIGPVGGNFFLPTEMYCDTVISCVPEFPSYGFRCYSDLNFPTYNVTSQDCDYDIRVSTEEKAEPILITVFPNPAQSFLFVANAHEAELNVTVFSMHGSKALTATLKNGSALDISDLPSGTYFLSVSANDWIYQKKIVKL